MVPMDTCLAQTTLQLVQIATYKTKLLECVSKMCSHWERNGFWTFKPVWVSLSPLWGWCRIAGKLPWTLFPDLFECIQVALRRKWIVITDLIQPYSICLPPISSVISGLQLFCAGIFIDVSEQAWRFRHLKLRWVSKIRPQLLYCMKTKLMILINPNKGFFFPRLMCDITEALSNGQSVLQEHLVHYKPQQWRWEAGYC